MYLSKQKNAVTSYEKDETHERAKKQYIERE